MSNEILSQILSQLEQLQLNQKALERKIDILTAGEADAKEEPVSPSTTSSSTLIVVDAANTVVNDVPLPPTKSSSSSSSSTSLYPGRVLLTTYPSQPGISPYSLIWGSPDPKIRGPVICSRLPSSIKRRNALGAHSGSYSIYRALSIAMGTLDPRHRPDFTNTQPPIDIPYNDAWSFGDGGQNATGMKIVSMDPFGHLAPTVFKDIMEKEGLDIKPSIAVTKARMRLSEIDESVRKGDINVDGNLVSWVDTNNHQEGVEIKVSKAAVEPVWWLPGVAERFGISESLLRRALFEDTGGMYPELITRPDIKVFLPPIGGLTAYLFGNPEFLRDETKYLTLRVHDECNGSDVFGSDICTCKPYLTYAIEECVRTVQNGGVGVVVYFRKEGRALGEVTKYLVYNLRKRGGDSADKYFASTELIAGVKDMRFQALMPDVLHWLGIKKIDAMVSMSDMKYNAIVGSGIPILKRYDIPEHLIPTDSRVEIDAKIAAGYFTSGREVKQEDLSGTVGRGWEEMEH